MVDPPAAFWDVGTAGAAVATVAMLAVGVDEIEETTKVTGGCPPVAVPGVQRPEYQVCNVPKSAGEQAGQTVEGVADNGLNKADSQKHD